MKSEAYSFPLISNLRATARQWSSYLREEEKLLWRWRWRSVRICRLRSENKSLCYSDTWAHQTLIGCRMRARCVCRLYVYVRNRWREKCVCVCVCVCVCLCLSVCVIVCVLEGVVSHDPGEGDGWNTVDGRGGLRFWKGAAEKLLLLNLQW